MISSTLFLTLALVNTHPTDVVRRPQVSVGVGVGFDFGHHYVDRHCHGYRGYYDPRFAVYAPVVVAQPAPIYVQSAPQVQVVERVVEKPVEKTVYVDKPVERMVYVDRTVYIEEGKTTIIEKVDGKIKSIVHAPSEPQKLDENAEMALLCNIRDEINKKLPLDVASVVSTGANKTVEFTLRATQFAPYDRVTRRYVISAATLTLVSQDDLTIHFNADKEGVSDLADDVQDLVLKMGHECLAQGGEWYLDNHFSEEPKKENGRVLKDVLADMEAKMKK